MPAGSLCWYRLFLFYFPLPTLYTMADTATAEAPVADDTSSTKPIFTRHENGVHVAVFRNVKDDGKVSYRIQDHYFYKADDGSFKETDAGFEKQTLQKVQYLQEAVAAIDEDKNSR